MMDDKWRGAARAPALVVLSFIIYHSASSIAIASAGEPPQEPTVSHGAGQVVRGVVVEMPKGVLEGTLDGPPVVGTAMGLLGGTVRALQVTAAGLVEMAQGFHPFERRRR
jgi:hypothetical protein